MAHGSNSAEKTNLGANDGEERQEHRGDQMVVHDQIRVTANTQNYGALE